MLDSTLLLFRHHDEAVEAVSGSALKGAVVSLLTSMRGQRVSVSGLVACRVSKVASVHDRLQRCQPAAYDGA